MPTLVHTIGHSNHAIEAFVALLREHGIAAVADVRSSPFSRYNPQFNRPTLEASLAEAGVRYVFLGEELGARRSEPECYVGGRVDYERVARMPGFRRGLDRVIDGASRMPVAMMCAEHDPLTCHRTILVTRNLAPLVDDVRHIRRDGSIETHAEAEARLLVECGMDVPDLFASPQERIVDAYRHRAGVVGYVPPEEEDES